MGNITYRLRLFNSSCSPLNSTAILGDSVAVIRILVLVFSIALAQKVPVNTASLEDLRTLPLTDSQVSALYEFVFFQGPVYSFYDLMDIPGFSAETLKELRPLVSLVKPRQEETV
ncbi:MAG TPA: hypothetical protein EYM60_05320, partial [Candidatus Marinimicrobia bacterium]|nr:hypothetical protein [Candidatus Neomarinimicrobiota bacterium]